MIDGNKKMTNEERTSAMSRVYRLYELFERTVVEIDKKLEELSPEKDMEEIKDLLSSCDSYKQNLNLMEESIKELRSDFFAFSVEEIYHQFGRYDKFISIDFHYNSESAKEYGRTIMGVPIYNRREREDIEVSLKKNPIPRTNGYIRFDLSELNEIHDDKISALKKQGFLSGDILEINYSQMDYKDAYNKKDEKEIPNTINIEIPFDPEFNPEFALLFLYSERIAGNKKPLIQREWDEYYTYKILYQEEILTEHEWTQIYEPNKKVIRKEIRFYIYKSKIARGIVLSEEELKDLHLIIAQRLKERTTLVENEINKSANKKLKDIIVAEETLYQKIKLDAFFYDTMNLSPYGAKFPIFLDLERYLHIFIRHCGDFQIGNWKNGGKLAFPYSLQDMKRLLELAIEDLTPQIEEKLEQGKEFNIFDKNAYYFNGNYYAVHIDNTGRLLSFYPYTNPD